MPVAIAGLVRQQRQHLRMGIGRGQAAIHRITPELHQFAHVQRLRTQAQHLHAHGLQRGQFLHQVAHMGRLRLDAVEREEGFAFARLQQQAIGVVDAAELAVVLGQIAVACREAARRKRQRHAAQRKHLGLQALRALLLQHLQLGLRHFQRRHPAHCAQIGHPVQRRLVVQVQVRAGDERQLAGHHLHRAHVVGFHQKLAVVDDAARHRSIAAGFHQHLRGQDGLLAGIAQHAGHVDPVGQAQLMPARADRFAQVDHVYRRLGHLLVELEHRCARPVVQQRPQGQLHAGRGLCRITGHGGFPERE